MALVQAGFWSNCLQKQVQATILLPDQGKGPFATFYLLHGLSDDHSLWLRRTRIEMYAAQYPMIVVMPDGYRGWYSKSQTGVDYGQYIAMEVPSFIERYFQAKASRKARAIGGLSMGGYGALRLAMRYPDQFASANSHSGAVLFGSRKWKKGEWFEAHGHFGSNPIGSENDLCQVARDAKAAGKLPKLMIDCGTEDFLYQDNVKFHGFLQEQGIPHEYAEHPGSHEWDYWDLHVREALAFHARNLKLPKG